MQDAGAAGSAKYVIPYARLALFAAHIELVLTITDLEHILRSLHTRAITLQRTTEHTAPESLY